MNKKHAAIAVAAASAAGIVLSSIGAVAKGPGGSGMGSGSGIHSSHFRGHLLSHHHHHHHFARRNFNNAWWYGGYYAMPPYDPDYGNNQNEQAPSVTIYARDYAPQVTCEKTRETIKVPSESGGTRDITVTRC